MSRYGFPTTDPETGQRVQVAYGFDDACGYFIQVFDNGEEDPRIDLDTLFDGLTGAELCKMLMEYANEPDEKIEEHMWQANLDLPF